MPEAGRRQGPGRAALALLASLALAQPARAEPTLEGRTVTLNVETWDDPARPFLVSVGRTAVVGPGAEFSMGPEGRSRGLDVVPVEVEIDARRIAFSYAPGAGKGRFAEAAFNGYVLRFATDCVLFEGVAIDAAFTTMAVTPADIRVEGGALFVDVAGRAFGPDLRLALDIRVGDCLLG